VAKPLLGQLALARGTVDRITHRRGDTEWLEQAWADPRTRVLVVDDGKALVRLGEGRAELVFVPVEQAPPGTRMLLGVDADGVVYFGVAGPLPGLSGVAPGGGLPGLSGVAPGGGPPGPPDGQGDVRAAALRQVGALLGDRDAGLFTHAVALANWHTSHTHCPRCGTPTVPDPSGHSTTCPRDGTEHFPRTDPAVIMLVTDPDDRALLARNANWPGRRVSILAGFVEPGESAEQAVVREVHEETGIAVGEVGYLGSQPWPMPRSLMLGFRATAVGGQQIRVDTEEIAEARWFSRDELRASLDTDEIRLPAPVSIAYRIIESWYGEPLPWSPEAASAWDALPSAPAPSGSGPDA
jgi:NAD+ diphosphatase